jgi:cell division protein FtsB
MKETLKILLPTFLIRILNAFRKVLINVKILAIDYRQFMNVIQ